MNLAPVRIKHAHGDGTRWPISVNDKLERAPNAPQVRCHFAKDVSPGVKELDSVLHAHKNKLNHSPVPCGRSQQRADRVNPRSPFQAPCPPFGGFLTTTNLRICVTCLRDRRGAIVSGARRSVLPLHFTTR
jgi:hypothetical protein